jgi:hypothetical protein
VAGVVGGGGGGGGVAQAAKNTESATIRPIRIRRPRLRLAITARSITRYWVSCTAISTGSGTHP